MSVDVLYFTMKADGDWGCSGTHLECLHLLANIFHFGKCKECFCNAGAEELPVSVVYISQTFEQNTKTCIT